MAYGNKVSVNFRLHMFLLADNKENGKYNTFYQFTVANDKNVYQTMRLVLELYNENLRLVYICMRTISLGDCEMWYYSAPGTLHQILADFPLGLFLDSHVTSNSKSCVMCTSEPNHRTVETTGLWPNQTNNYRDLV